MINKLFFVLISSNKSSYFDVVVLSDGFGIPSRYLEYSTRYHKDFKAEMNEKSKESRES